MTSKKKRLTAATVSRSDTIAFRDTVFSTRQILIITKKYLPAPIISRFGAGTARQKM